MDSAPERRTSRDFILSLAMQQLELEALPEPIARASLEVVASSLGELFAKHPVSGLLTGAGGVRVGVIEHSKTWSAATGDRVFYIEVDLMNLGGVNAQVGSSKANEIFIKPTVATIIEQLETLIEGCDGAWYEAWHHGGDELSFLVGGVNERTLTEHLDQAVRLVYYQCRQAGLALIPHPKHPWKFSKWGAGISYGYTLVDDSSVLQILTRADTRLEQYKRGLAPDAHSSKKDRGLSKLIPDPKALSWHDRLRMARVLLNAKLSQWLRTK